MKKLKAMWDKFTDGLVDDWKQAWKWFSVQLAAVYSVIAAYAVAEPTQFANLLAMLPDGVKVVVVVALTLIPVYARLKKQGNTTT